VTKKSTIQPSHHTLEQQYSHIAIYLGIVPKGFTAGFRLDRYWYEDCWKQESTAQKFGGGVVEVNTKRMRT
jgi:hypothetical protein